MSQSALGHQVNLLIATVVFGGLNPIISGDGLLK
jgi:hypothetical protein